MDYRAFREELSKPEYASMDDAARLAAINAKTMTVKRPIPFDRVAKDLIATGTYAKALLYAQNEANEEGLREICLTVRAAVDNEVFTDLDPGDEIQGPQIKAMLDGLQTSGCLSAEVRALILGRANVAVPFWQTVALREIQPADIEVARTL